MAGDSFSLCRGGAIGEGGYELGSVLFQGTVQGFLPVHGVSYWLFGAPRISQLFDLRSGLGTDWAGNQKFGHCSVFSIGLPF